MGIGLKPNCMELMEVAFTLLGDRLKICPRTNINFIYLLNCYNWDLLN